MFGYHSKRKSLLSQNFELFLTLILAFNESAEGIIGKIHRFQICIIDYKICFKLGATSDEDTLPHPPFLSPYHRY